jgi:transcriptional regulator with XRE-family HTH domain
MPYTNNHSFDEAVIDRINDYIESNNLSIKKVAVATGMSYQQLYQLLHKNRCIKLREYIRLCKAFNEPVDAFVKGINNKD